MPYKRGDVVLGPFPFSDLSTAKVRPAVVVSSELHHRTQPDLLRGALTSRVTAATGALDYCLVDWRSAGLRFPTGLKPVIVALDPSRIVHHVGALSVSDLNQVDIRLFQALGL